MALLVGGVQNEGFNGPAQADQNADANPKLSKWAANRAIPTR